LYIILIITAYDNNVFHIYNGIHTLLAVVENFAKTLSRGDVRTVSVNLGESFAKKICRDFVCTGAPLFLEIL